MKAGFLFRFDGTVDRRVYALVGIFGFLLKHLVDRVVAWFLFGETWGLFSYWHSPFRPTVPLPLLMGNARFAAAMLAVALPFIWIGLSMTVRRLRSLAYPCWLALLFFVPLVNILFFALLCALPPERGRPETPGLIQNGAGRSYLQHPLASAAIGVAVTLLILLPGVWISTMVVSSYGWSLFVGAPFGIGLFSTLIHSMQVYRSLLSCLFVATLALFCACLLLLALAFEGVICIIMAFPLAWILTACGAVLGYTVQKHRRGFSVTVHALPVWGLLLGATLLEGWVDTPPPLFEVTTAVEVHAPPERVWPHVISFADLGPPREWLFRTGIAYPIRAEISGEGPGSVRHCVFSTGSFVEPIEVWDAPRRLSFRVVSNPPPMEEWSPYRQLAPSHLSGFLESKRGEFTLAPLGSGSTLLRGTTWYYHGLWPASYWKWWSDFIIHRIHIRVLDNIRKRSERGP